MKLDHLVFPTDGWGYTHYSNEVLNIYKTTMDMINPKNIFEIGFRYGHSATYMLELSDAVVYSIDPSQNPLVQSQVKKMKEVYKDRHHYEMITSDRLHADYYPVHFDLALVDGQHTFDWVIKDIRKCKMMKIPYLLFDNCEKREVMEAINSARGVDILRVFVYSNTHKGNTVRIKMVLCHVQYNNI